jgi:enediyne biosynthesis protein E3
MSTTTGRLRTWVLMPRPDEVTFAKRGFAPAEPVAQRRLEETGTTFLYGMGLALQSSGPSEFTGALDDIERQLRGFAYEGAAMGVAIGDAMTPWPRRQSTALATGAGAKHKYMLQVGIGWAMARLPKMLWSRIVSDDPLLRWLALDGFGFHQAYFSTERFVRRHETIRLTPPWPDPSGYAPRALDQGVGRALWFVCGADVERAAAQIGGFAPERQADLWSGLGLAATYAGYVDTASLETLWKLAGEYRPDVAQGSAFAAKARLLADLVTPHTVEAVRVFCGVGVVEAAGLTDQTLAGLPADSAEAPAFEVWRRRTQEALRVVTG